MLNKNIKEGTARNYSNFNRKLLSFRNVCKLYCGRYPHYEEKIFRKFVIFWEKFNFGNIYALANCLSCSLHFRMPFLRLLLLQSKVMYQK